MSDLIDRQALITKLNRVIEHGFADKRGRHMLSAEMMKDVVECMPSEEPQIIRCKDCKHRDPEDKKCDCGHDIWWQLPRRDDWYCADAERRTE